jgi:Adenylate and Guanylate cyclase catalytic domain
MEFRIGINLGDVITEGKRIYGDRVNIAARLESLADAGGLCISGTVYDQVKTKLALDYEELGAQAVKNIAEPVRFRRFPTNNLEAYDALLRGREYSNRFTQAANAQARQLFESAIALDSQYAAAYALLGLTHLYEWVFQWSQDSQTLEQAFALAQKAVALNDSLPVAHRVLGSVYV